MRSAKKRTNLVAGLVQSRLKVADGNASAHRHPSRRAVNAVRLQLAKINCQALLKAIQGGGVSMAAPRGEKRDIVDCGQFDLEYRTLDLILLVSH